MYQELLELGVVNSNVRLGDLSRLLQDVNFGETMTSDKGMRLLLKPLSKLKSVSFDIGHCPKVKLQDTIKIIIVKYVFLIIIIFQMCGNVLAKLRFNAV